jgi:hypothetical protein
VQGKCEHVIIWLLLNAFRLGASVIDPDDAGTVMRPLLLVDPPGVQSPFPMVHWVILRTGPAAFNGTLWRRPAGTTPRMGNTGRDNSKVPSEFGRKGVAMLDEPWDGKSDAVLEPRAKSVLAHYVPTWARECRY